MVEAEEISDVSPELASGGGEMDGRWNCMNFFWGLFLGGSNAEKLGDHQKKISKDIRHIE